MNFKSWLFGLDKTSLGQMRSKLYFIVIVFLVMGLIAICVLSSMKTVSQNTKIKIAKILSILLLVSNVINLIVKALAQKKGIQYYWPLYPCRLNAYIVPIVCLTNSKLLKKMFYVIGIIGAVWPFVFNYTIWAYDVMYFDILESTIRHALLIYIPMIEFVSNTFRPKLIDSILAIDGWFVHMINVFLVTTLFNLKEDYLFLNSDVLPNWLTPKPLFIILLTIAITFLIHLVFYLIEKLNRRKL